MYPFTDDNVFLRNCWYVVATTAELDESSPIERTVMGEPIVLFRTSDGAPVALHGICPHRYYPLARGRVIDDAIQCNYHGLRFDGRTGACVRVPSQSAVPRGYRQRVYPVVEHGPWLWLWAGDPGLATRTTLPSLEAMGMASNWNVIVGPRLEGHGRSQLLVENLMDLTHIDYLHATTLEAEGVLNFPVRMREETGSFYATRMTRTPWVHGFYDLLYRPENRFEGLHDAIGETWYFSPAYIRTSLVIEKIDAHATLDRGIYGCHYFQHFVTPATPQSLHYFVGMSRNYRRDDIAFSEAMLAVDVEVRKQDIAAIAQIERYLSGGSRPALGPELLVKADAPAIRVRRHIQRQLDAEKATVASRAAS